MKNRTLQEHFQADLKQNLFSGGSAFTIDLWDKDSDPFLQAIFFCASLGAVMCIQLAKLFIAERNLEQESNVSGKNFTTLHQFPPHQETHKSFESHIEIVYFIFGALSVVGTAMLMCSWLHSGCKLCHWVHNTENEAKTLLESPQFHKPKTLCLFGASVLLCSIAFLGLTAEENFSALGITFAVNSLNWAKNDAGNLVSLYWGSLLVSRCVSIALAKCFSAENLLTTSVFISFAGTLLMTFTLKVMSFSLWVGTLLLGLGLGNSAANTLNAGKRLTSQTGFIVSLIMGSRNCGKIVAPLLVGYLMDHEDPMWFLYLGVMYCGGMFLLSVVFQILWTCGANFSESASQS